MRVSNDSQTCWFALRVTYCRELDVKQKLETMGIETFIPMRYEYFVKNRSKVKRLVPAIHNLLFVHTQKQILDKLKHTTSLPIRYVMGRDEGRSFILAVSDSEMENFMRVAATYDEQLTYLDPSMLNLHDGDLVRVTSGPFAGAVGRLQRIKGKRARRVVVSLENFVHVVVTYIPLSCLEKIV